MNNDRSSVGFNEFIDKGNETRERETSETDEEPEDEVSIEEAPELDVQKAVVESLAEDKVKMEHEIESLKDAIAKKEAEIEVLSKKVEETETKLKKASEDLEEEKKKKSRLESEISNRIERELDTQERNPNALALLDRNIEIQDRFPGETRDQVIEALKEARDKAEADGKIRRAQLIESVLVENEPNGTLAKKREELEKLFADNSNLVTGVVIEELKRLGIRYKDGENYLMPSEIIKREY